jgi:histidinol-phosphate aminotransferase
MTDFEALIRDDIRALSPYHVQDARGMVKLDAMENPYPLPEAVRRDVGVLAVQAPVNRYPDAHAVELQARLREVMGIAPEAGLLLGNGSDEIIQMMAMAVARPGAALLSVEPSFAMFRILAVCCGLRYVGVPLRADFSLDAEATLAAIAEHRPALTFIAYPNNPTGNLFAAEDIRRIIESSPGLVVVDEAYYAFSPASFLPELLRYPNLLLMRTASKLGLAGLRLGLLAGPPRLIREFDKVRLPYNINVLTQTVASRALQEMPALEAQAEVICGERTKLFAALQSLPEVRPFPSQANFVLFQVVSANRVFDALKQHGILVKNLHGSHPLLEDCLRVTVGTPEQNEQFIAALQSILALA